MQDIKIKYKNEVYSIQPLLTVEEFILHCKINVVDPVAVVINGRLTRLSSKLSVDSSISIISLHSPQGKKIYEGSLFFLLIVALKKKFVDINFKIEHSLVRGVYIRIMNKELEEKDVQLLTNYMHQMIDENWEIDEFNYDWDKALSMLDSADRDDINNLYLYHLPSNYHYYQLFNIKEDLYLPLIPRTGMLKDFSLTLYEQGLVLIIPDFDMGKDEVEQFVPSPKIIKAFDEFEKWSSILKAHTVGDLNKHIMSGEIENLIKIAEAFHEKKVANIADQIVDQHSYRRLVLIAGPSSSGKTTFAKRLSIQLQVNGHIPLAISLDNYFVDRDQTPRDSEGNYDFENIEAIDTKLFSSQMNALLEGEEVSLPRFNFFSGNKINKGEKIKLQDNQIVIVEGIHGLNPLLTRDIGHGQQTFKIYIAPITPIGIHHHDRIDSSDIRLIRRLVRDSFFRGYSASDTLTRWDSVRKGEQKNIFPLQEESDAIFNSILFYELSALKFYAERELLRITRNDPTYAEGQRLLKILAYFLPMNLKSIPNNSILKEFIGGSSFHY